MEPSFGLSESHVALIRSDFLGSMLVSNLESILQPQVVKIIHLRIDLISKLVVNMPGCAKKGACVYAGMFLCVLEMDVHAARVRGEIVT